MRVSIASPFMQPSPNGRRVGIRIVTFEACSSFTYVTAHRIAQSPKATFVTRLQPCRLPNRAARQLPDQSTILRVEFPPLIIAPSGRTAIRRHRNYSAASALDCVSFGLSSQASSQLKTSNDFTSLPTPSVMPQSSPSSMISSSLKCCFNSS